MTFRKEKLRSTLHPPGVCVCIAAILKRSRHWRWNPTLTKSDTSLNKLILVITSFTSLKTPEKLDLYSKLNFILSIKSLLLLIAT